MIVYYHGSPDKPPVAEHTLIVCPAGHRPKDCPEDDWWDKTGERPKAKEFTIKFFHGEAEVSDPLGKYLIATDMAKKTRYSPPNLWMPQR